MGTIPSTNKFATLSMSKCAKKSVINNLDTNLPAPITDTVPVLLLVMELAKPAVKSAAMFPDKNVTMFPDNKPDKNVKMCPDKNVTTFPDNWLDKNARMSPDKNAKTSPARNATMSPGK